MRKKQAQGGGHSIPDGRQDRRQAGKEAKGGNGHII